MPEEPQPAQKPDFRIYIGMLFFRWQIIAVCFLYCLLGGVVYLHLAPKSYGASCQLMIYRDPKMDVGGGPVWDGWQTHRYLLTEGTLRRRAWLRIRDEWATKIAKEKQPILQVAVWRSRALGPSLQISVRTVVPEYGVAFLRALIEEHEQEWKTIQTEAAVSASRMLEEELSKLEEKIDEAEDALIEYERLHDLARVSARGAMESAYLTGLMGRRNQLLTEQMLLEAQYEALKNENPVVINHVNRLTRETGAVKPVRVSTSSEPTRDYYGGDVRAEGKTTVADGEPAGLALPPDEDFSERDAEDARGWQELRVRLIRLQQEERSLVENLTPDHPRLVAVRGSISNVKNHLALAAEIELRKLRDRQRSIAIQLEAIEGAEYKWQAKDSLAAKRRAQMKRISSVVSRFEGNYNTLYGRLHTMRVQQELESEQFYMAQQPTASGRPSWPDPMKILLAVVALGLGSGFGLALVLQVLDNKVQSIKDVEEELGIPFLGGIPFWVHSGLEKAIRPIVTEEHASGAVEAYRALRTMIIGAMNKANEKILLVTSADSREGKTLTALNLSIVLAQMNKKVLLVDMDLRRGRLHRSLGLEREPGVTDVLREGRSLKEVIVRTRVENLYLASTGGSVEDSAELLQSGDLVSLFVDVQDDYDYIICDTSPVLRVTDTVILATHGLGVVLYIARVNHTPKPLIRYSLDMLEDARVLGLVMNSIEMHKISSLYYTYQYPNYAYYSNAYAYGYDYYRFDDGSKSGRRAAKQAAWRNRARSAAKWLRRTFLPLD